MFSDRVIFQARILEWAAISLSSIFPTQRLNPCLLSWQVDSLLLSHQGSDALPLVWFSSVQFSHSVVSNSLRPHESQYARPPCLSLTPGVYSNPCPSSRWCHPAISSSVVPFSSCSPIPPSIRVFSNESTLRMTWPKYWSFSFSISPSNEHPGLISFRMDWLDLSGENQMGKVFKLSHKCMICVSNCPANILQRPYPQHALLFHQFFIYINYFAL